MVPDEAGCFADSIVSGEADDVWAEVMADVDAGRLRARYHGGRADLSRAWPVRDDIVHGRYTLGSVQTVRGCPQNCSFCSVTAFNGGQYRARPIAHVIDDLRRMPEARVLITDDNIIGTKPEHVERAKDLFRAMIDARLGKRWIGQASLNIGDDEETVRLAAASGCSGVFIGFESPDHVALRDMRKQVNLQDRDPRETVRLLHRYGIPVIGSYILGLDTDEPGIGRRIAETALQYDLDLVATFYLTPLPGTRMWTQLEQQGRIIANQFPQDWRHYTFRIPVIEHAKLTADQLIAEDRDCTRIFYRHDRMLGRIVRRAGCRMGPVLLGIGNWSMRARNLSTINAYPKLVATEPRLREPPQPPNMTIEPLLGSCSGPT